MKILNNKKIKDSLNRLVANYIISIDALKKIEMSVSDYSDASEHIIDNTITIANNLGGIKAMYYVNNQISEYENNKN